MTNSPAIEVLDLHRALGDNKAVQGVSFEVQRGEIFSLLGPNGAGKTTTISMQLSAASGRRRCVCDGAFHHQRSNGCQIGAGGRPAGNRSVRRSDRA